MDDTNAVVNSAVVSDTILVPASKLRGFARMDPAKVKEYASRGGKAAHASGNAHKFNSEEAKAASLKAHAKRGVKTG